MNTAVAWKNRIVGTGEEAPDQLLANPRNWRIHPKHQQDALEAVLGEVGWVQNVIVNQRSGHVVDGHLRVSVALRREEPTVPVVYVDLSDAEEALILASIDPLAAMAVVDEAKLAELLEEIETNSPELQKMLKEIAEENGVSYGATGEEVDAEPQIDRAAELQEKWKTECGQVWQLGAHRLMCGDSTATEDVQKLSAGQLMRLVVTDPPYGVSYADKNKFLNVISPANRVETPIENDHGDKEATQAMWKAAFKEMATIMDRGAVVYCFMPQGGDQMMMMMMMMGAGIEPRHELIWLKNNHVLGRVDYAYKHEPILYAWKAGGHHFYGGFQTSILEFPKPQSSEFHPTMKPVPLLAKLLGNSSVEGEAVYDPFVGSGSTLLACEQLNRRCFAMEISPAYCAVSIQRFADATGKEPTLLQ